MFQLGGTWTVRTVYAHGYNRSRGDSERIVCGIYVDNLQLVHSASLDDPDSEVSRFVADLKREWDIEDEGPMTDLLAMELNVTLTGVSLSTRRSTLTRYFPSLYPTVYLSM